MTSLESIAGSPTDGRQRVRPLDRAPTGTVRPVTVVEETGATEAGTSGPAVSSLGSRGHPDTSRRGQRRAPRPPPRSSSWPRCPGTSPTRATSRRGTTAGLPAAPGGGGTRAPAAADGPPAIVPAPRLAPPEHRTPGHGAPQRRGAERARRHAASRDEALARSAIARDAGGIVPPPRLEFLSRRPPHTSAGSADAPSCRSGTPAAACATTRPPWEFRARRPARRASVPASARAWPPHEVPRR